MIARDDKWVMESKEPEAAPPKKKRLVTEAMKTANMKNAHMSKNTKTEEGRRRSALNATKSAHTCNTFIFLESESTDEFDREVAVTVRRLGAKTEPEIAQVRLAVYQEWKARRIERAEVSAVKKATNAIAESFHDTMESDVRTHAAALEEAPGESVARLMKTSIGCSYLIGQFEILEEWMAEYPSFEDCMRGHALRLGGHDPKFLFRDPLVMELNRAYLVGMDGAAEGLDAEGAADALVYDRPEDMSPEEFLRRMRRLIIDLPNKVEARGILQDYVKDNIQSLTDLRALLERCEARDLDDAIGEALATTTVEGDRRHRYGATATRLSHASYRMFFAMQAQRWKYGEGDLDGLDQVTGPAATAGPPADAPQTGAAGAGESECRNEAVAAQVAGGSGDSSTTSAASEPISEVPAGAGHDPLPGPIEAGRQEHGRPREFDRLE